MPIIILIGCKIIMKIFFEAYLYIKISRGSMKNVKKSDFVTPVTPWGGRLDPIQRVVRCGHKVVESNLTYIFDLYY